MNNMRRGFTMIELIFVIVIIGILSAVALPRFTGVSADAHLGKLKAFTATLNETVGPSIWSGLQTEVGAANGSVLFAGLAAKFNTIGTQADAALGADAQLESIPSEFGAITNIALACAAAGTAIPPVGATSGSGIGGDIATTSTIGTDTYKLGCVDGSLNGAVKFYLYGVNSDTVIAR